MKILMLVGPSGSGKSTIEKELNSENGFHKVVSHTTRKKRVGEIEGIDYHFVDKEFFQMNESDFAEIVLFNETNYGAHKNSFNENLLNILVVEPHGQIEISNYFKDKNVEIITVLLDIQKEKQLERMISRGDSEEDVISRLQNENIREEMYSLDFDFSINTDRVDLEKSVNLIKSYLKEGI